MRFQVPSSAESVPRAFGGKSSGAGVKKGTVTDPAAAWRAGANPGRIYVAIQYGIVAGDIEFDWDDENRKHLAAHKVAPAEFEQLLNNNPVDLDYDLIDNEKRHRSVGLTNGGRLLSVAWTIRNGKVRAITAFPAGVSDRKAFLERPK